ncbi:MAG: efflux RND transporter permease subunit, partial [Gemmata sp.]
MTAVIDFALNNRFLVVLGSLLLAPAGLAAMTRLPVDAVPDVTNVQVQVMTTAPALSPLEIEQAVTLPVESAMSGMPRVEEIRSVSQFGLSVVTVVFEEGTDIYWARQMVGERLQSARENIPAGVPSPKLGPIATGLGEIYQFEVRHKPGQKYTPSELRDLERWKATAPEKGAELETRKLMELREVLDWQIGFQLRSVPGVIEVNTNGGALRAYEVRIDPRLLHEAKIPIGRVFEALQQNNGNEGGGYLLLHSKEQRVVRGEGLVGSRADLERIVLDTRADGTPVYLGQVATVTFAPVIRQGAVTRDGQGEGVVGVVMLLAGENSRAVVERVKDKIADVA